MELHNQFQQNCDNGNFEMLKQILNENELEQNTIMYGLIRAHIFDNFIITKYIFNFYKNKILIDLALYRSEEDYCISYAIYGNAYITGRIIKETRITDNYLLSLGTILIIHIILL